MGLIEKQISISRQSLGIRQAWKNTALARFIHNKSSKKSKELRIPKYREFDTYQLDIVKTPPVEIHIPKLLPSEPPEGVTYRFGPSGYISKGKNTDVCVIHTEWRSVKNYCHWTFSEVPLMHLALESNAKYIILPDALLNVFLPFQIRWLEILDKIFPDKTILALSELSDISNGIIPVNHDTSSSNSLIGKGRYRDYHAGRATPYCIQMIDGLKGHFHGTTKYSNAKSFINRRKRRLKNEDKVQEYLISEGFLIVNLEELTLDEQVSLFSTASVVIGFHGAGLANIIFCNTNINIVEIVDSDCVYPSYIDGLVVRGKKAPRTFYHVVAHMKGLNYFVLESVDYTLNLEKLKNFLRNCLQLSTDSEIIWGPFLHRGPACAPANETKRSSPRQELADGSLVL